MVLGGGMSSRLFQEVRENLGLAYSIYAFNYTHLDSGIFGIYAGTTPEKTNELLKATCKETLKICEKITDKELQRVRTQFEASLLMSKESTNSRSQRLGSDVLSYGRLISDKEILDKVPDVLIINHSELNHDYVKEVEKINISYKKYNREAANAHNLKTYKIKQDNTIKNYEKIVNFNGHKYKLDSCLIFNYNKGYDNHIIAGITCNKNRYVFNS
jgi:hypothetical protein